MILAAPPGDGISSLSFSPVKNELLLVSSWDSTTRLYDVVNNIPKMTFDFGGAVLSSCFDPSGLIAYSGGLDKIVYKLDLSRGMTIAIGGHNDAISCMHFCNYNNTIFTGSWDRTVTSWDSRSSRLNQQINLVGKVYSMSGTDTRMVFATSSKQIIIYDVRNMSEPEQIRESPLRHQLRRVACDIVTHEGFVVGSTEGRVAVEYFDINEEVQSRKYAFKCHRKDDLAYPVNAIAFHPIYGSFATGGSDGYVNIWDGANRKRLAQMRPYPTSISALAFSCDGTILAVSSSYGYEQGLKPVDVEDNVYVQILTELEVKPRARVTT